MNREEERGNAAEQYVEGFHSAIQRMCKESFVDGAKWSDENPKEGLVDIDKAVKFLEQWDAYRLCVEGHKEFFIENFKKAMKE